MTRTIVFADFYDETKAWVSREEAAEVVRSPENEQQIVYGKSASAGIHIKQHGSENSSCPIIVLTTPDNDRTVVHFAFRVPHSLCETASQLTAIDALNLFLGEFGVEVSLPRMGRASLFIREWLDVPTSVVTDDQVMQYLLHIVDGQFNEPFAMISNFKLDPVSHSLTIPLLAFYSTDRYEQAMRANTHVANTTSAQSTIADETLIARAEYKKLLFDSGYQPQCIDADWIHHFADECKTAGWPEPKGNAGDVVSYQGILDATSNLVEHFIRERGHNLKHGVFVGECPLGLFRASVSTETCPRRALVLVNVGLMAHSSRTITPSPNLHRCFTILHVGLCRPIAIFGFIAPYRCLECVDCDYHRNNAVTY